MQCDMDKDVRQIARNSLKKLLATKKEQLESAVTVGEYWKIQCEIDSITNKLTSYNYGDKV